MVIFDTHVHVFPNRIADKATASVGKFYNLEMTGDGRLDAAIKALDDAGIEKFVAHSVATSPLQVPRINEFIMEARALYPDRLIPFAAMHPGVENIDRAMDEIVAAGFKGVKIHPDIQNYSLDAPDVMRMIGAIAGRLPLLIHTGDFRYDNSGPYKMARVLDEFPNLVAICAHLGGWSEWELAESVLAGRNVYVDTSSSLYALAPERAAEIIRAFGADRAFFGSDFPMWRPKDELERFMKLPLTDSEREAILSKNAARFFGMDC